MLLVVLWVIVLPGVGFWGLYFLWGSIIYDCWFVGGVLFRVFVCYVWSLRVCASLGCLCRFAYGGFPDASVLVVFGVGVACWMLF